jgi:DNA (cytosine-5)-methyltransferase 1
VAEELKERRVGEIRTYATHFCGLGGACWGLEQAGLECRLAIDYLDYAVKCRLNNLGHEALCMDINEHDPGPKDAADLLWTSPPCQTFSSCSREWVYENKDDRRNNLFLNSIRYLDKAKPRFVVMENVPGLETHGVNHEGSGTLDTMIGYMKRAGYHVEWNTLDPKDFGLPQGRQRVFVVGSRDGEKGLIPAEPMLPSMATFGSIMERGSEALAWGKCTYETALNKVRRLAKKHGSFGLTVVADDDVAGLVNSPPAVTFPAVERQPAIRARYQLDDMITYVRAIAGRASTCLPTITCGWGGGATRKKVAILDEAGGRFFLRHPSVREGARAQGFPESWSFPENDSKAWTLVGNAVASPVAKAIASHLVAISRGERPRSKLGLFGRHPAYAHGIGKGAPSQVFV